MSIKDTTRELADLIQKDYLVYNPESQNLETKKGAIDAVIKHTGAAVTEKEMDAVFGLTNQFVAATALATGELGVETMVKHKEIESLSAKFDIAKGVHTEHIVTRDYVSRTPPQTKGGEATETIKHGRVESTLTIRDNKDARGRNGEHKHIRNHVYDLGAEKLGK